MLDPANRRTNQKRRRHVTSQVVKDRMAHSVDGDPDLGYLAIVDRVVAEFPDAKTSVRSVASVAAGLRKKGVDVPIRRKIKSSD